MKRPWRRRVLLIAVAALVALPFAVPCVRFALVLSRTTYYMHLLRGELNARYPSVNAGVTRQITSRHLFVVVYGVPEPERRAEMRGWLADWKAQRGTDLPITLMFSEAEDSLTESFKL